MSLPLLLLALSAQSAPAGAQQCGMIAATGDPVVFGIATSGPQATLVPTSGTAWPSAKIVTPRTQSGASETVVIGSGSERLALELGPIQDGMRSATLFQTNATLKGLPVAVGYCVEDDAKDTSGARTATVADATSPAFAYDRWMQKCLAITSEGKRVVIDPRYAAASGSGDLTISFQAPGYDLWSAPTSPVVLRDTGTRKIARDLDLTTDAFAPARGKTGPRGTRVMYTQMTGKESAILSSVFEFSDLSSPAATGARALCNANGVVRTQFTPVGG
ncbi:hypothetical protein P1X14_01415 [Sphingomonas sp. AOB5]|uniref:hypothetical protein n=1 Tax=Sphingomonas sp. AOB5 TaxID=3034017 RepID=UPI0023F7C7C7|nr:hypothetical protein [Sphingomonas sp. AOB5]MDF7773890.1 hypothetical protein [Sphingomonas sp. AOB5]